MRDFLAPLLAACTLAACAPAPARVSTVPIHVRRELTAPLWHGPDSSGGLEVAARSLIHPTVPLAGAHATLHADSSAASPALLGGRADSLGYVSFGYLRPGRYVVRVRRLTYQPLVVVVDLPAGCATRVEMYLWSGGECMDGCGWQPPRSLVTTCRTGEA